MIPKALLNQIPAKATVIHSAKLSDFTTFQLGGACPALIHCPDAQALAEIATLFHTHSVPFMVIGQGSNLLVSDAGVDCVVLRYCADEAPDIQFDGDYVQVSGHTLLDDLARLTLQNGLGDLSFCSGIPGTVGGAIAGNAGAFGKQIGDVVESVQLLNTQGEVHETPHHQLDFKYRSSSLKQTGDVVLSARIKLQLTPPLIMEMERTRILEFRKNKHPDWRTQPCAGSVFRNIEPTSAAERRQAAGWFLEEAGAKGLYVGAAHLFENHANIIIAEPGASAQDVFELTEHMIHAVEKQFGFTLKREIKLIGIF